MASSLRFLFCLLLATSAFTRADEAYPPPVFTDPQRIAKLQAAWPAIDKIFLDYVAASKIPGMAWGVVLDGRVAHVGVSGVQDLSTRVPVSPATVFRIASMTKSFTTLALLKLRDEGKLGLDDPVSKWIPQFATMQLPTRDSPPLTIRQLLSHSAGFPEDNPWGDQQLAASDEDLTRWLQQGIPFSTPPGTRYEYSNYAFALLGRIVTRAAGMPYESYLRLQILDPLHMPSSTLEFSDVPVTSRAVGYRLTPNGTFLQEAPLPQGAFGAMGGLLTNATDLGNYVAFHLAAWPPRDDEDLGPVRRSSVREMSHLWTPSNLTARRVDGRLQVSETGYGFGLRVTTDCRFEHIVAHGGGLPGFGSYMAWLPDYGVGMFAMATLTYSGPSEAVSHAWDALLATGGLQRRELPPSPILTSMRERIWALWQSWDDGKLQQVASMNLLKDASIAQRRADIRVLKGEVGECKAAGPLRPENWLRGQFNLTCEKGIVGIFFTLAPTQPPAIQHLEFRRLDDAATRMSAPTGAAAGVVCHDG